jgi:hypothetical protein
VNAGRKWSLTLVHAADHLKLIFRHHAARLTSSRSSVPGGLSRDAVHKTSLGYSQGYISLFYTSVPSSCLGLRTGNQVRTESKTAFHFFCPRTSGWLADCYGGTRRQGPDMEHKTDPKRVSRALRSSTQVTIDTLDAYRPSPRSSVGIFGSVACQRE